MLREGFEEDPPEGTPDELDNPGSDADTTAASGRLEEAYDVSRKLRDMSDHKRECLEHLEKVNLPWRAPNDPDDPHDGMAAPDSV